MLRDFVEKASYVLSFFPSCADPITRVLCNYYYYPCGSNGTVHVPQYTCTDVCQYVVDTLCRAQWMMLDDVVAEHVRTDPFYTNDPTLFVPKCNETYLPLAFLELSNDCCVDGGIDLPKPGS